MKVLPDTTAYVGFKRSLSEAVNAIVRADDVLFSTIVLGELMFGFRNGSRFEKNMEELEAFLEHEAVRLVRVGRTTSDRYARIATHLKKQGTPIPTNDIWIAAQAMEHGAELITSDRHFNRISGLVCTLL
jgi:tRNA(fMet)-specific endonuclease VapC